METDTQRRPRLMVTRCFCLTLRQGVIIIAALELITFISLITYNGTMLARAVHRSFLDPLVIIHDLLETIIHFGVAMLLVIGVWRERRHLVYAWIYTRLVVLGTDVFTMLIASAIHINWPYVVFALILIPIYICFLIVIRSYALELKARDKLEPVGETTSHHDVSQNDVT